MSFVARGARFSVQQRHSCRCPGFTPARVPALHAKACATTITGTTAVMAFLCLWMGNLLAQAPTKPPTKTVLDGVFTEAQAAKGKAAYATYCATCHRADLGGFSGPPLTGALFLDRWREFNLNVLYDLIVTTMPASNVGSLKPDEYLAITAHILQSNGIPAGARELTAEATSSTLLVGKDGPQPLPNSAMVSAVGCLTLDSGNGYFLTMATEPVRTLNPYDITADELRDAKTQELGPLLFRLQNIGDLPGFNPDELVGNKMEAKGVLVRQPNNPRINVLALKQISPGCEP